MNQNKEAKVYKEQHDVDKGEEKDLGGKKAPLNSAPHHTKNDADSSPHHNSDESSTILSRQSSVEIEPRSYHTDTEKKENRELNYTVATLSSLPNGKIEEATNTKSTTKDVSSSCTKKEVKNTSNNDIVESSSMNRTVGQQTTKLIGKNQESGTPKPKQQGPNDEKKIARICNHEIEEKKSINLVPNSSVTKHDPLLSSLSGNSLKTNEEHSSIRDGNTTSSPTKMTVEIDTDPGEKGTKHASSTYSGKNSNSNPYLNKTVRIIKGQFEGLTGKVVKLHSRGWWTLDNPLMNGKSIHPRFCELVDKIDPLELESFYKYRSKNKSLPGIILRQQEQSKKERDIVKAGVASLNSNDTHRPQRSTRRATSTSNQHISSPPAKRARSSPRTSSPSKKHKGLSKTRRVMITSTMKETSRMLLQPVLTQQVKKNRCIMNQILPPFVLDTQLNVHRAHERLSHLSPEYRIEVFNRKSGRVLKGNNAIKLKDLPSVLRRHAEYEPLIPAPPKNTDSRLNNSAAPSGQADLSDKYFPSEARSSPNTRINRDVQPQTNVRASTIEGRKVRIIAGPYRGSSGKIESCIPGNWYLVSQLSKKNRFDLDYIVHAKNLEIIPIQNKHVARRQNDISTKMTENKDAHSNCTLPLTKSIKALEQRLESLEEKLGLVNSMQNKDEIDTLRKDRSDVKAKLEAKRISFRMLKG